MNKNRLVRCGSGFLLPQVVDRSDECSGSSRRATATVGDSLHDDVRHLAHCRGGLNDEVSGVA
jgi:hypothetical protein